MKRYIELFSIPNVSLLVIASFPARIAYGMIRLAIFFKTEQATNSVAFAGLAIGLNSIAGSLTAGIRGSIMDRFGQKWPFGILVPSYSAMLLALSYAQEKNSILLLSLILGLCAPPINLSVRPLWKVVVPAHFLRTAYAIDSSIMNTAGVSRSCYCNIAGTFFLSRSTPSYRSGAHDYWRWLPVAYQGFTYVGTRETYWKNRFNLSK